MTVNNLDPELKHLLGDATDEEPIVDDDPDCDPVGALIFEAKYHVPDPAIKKQSALAPPEPQSIAEIATSLNNLRRAIGGQNPFASRLQKLNVSFASLAASSEEYLGADSAVTNFFQGAANGDDDAMKIALRRMLVEDAPIQ